MSLELPEILNMPDKMLPMVENFNDYRYFLIEGGRGSGKTQTIGRLCSYLGEKLQARIVCGRETQNSIEESVYTVLSDLIREYDLNYEVQSQKITHRESGSTIRFKGFREQGSVNIKGLEGVDLLWIDEAQAISKVTLDVLIPTIRKDNAKVIFTMNRHTRDDAVYNFLQGRKDCLHIKINYFDNPFCPLSLKIEAEECKNRSEKDYNHIWLGQPLATAADYVFNFDKLENSKTIQPFGDMLYAQRVVGFDFAAQGDDLCVATTLDRASNRHWKTEDMYAWDEPDTMVSVGKIVSILGEQKPDVAMIDIGGMGKPVFDRLQELGIDILPFDGASTDGVDRVQFSNKRAQGYFSLSEWVNQGNLIIPKEYSDVHNELEKIRFKYHSSGRKTIQSKIDMKKEMGFSPDFADSMMMAVYATRYLGENSNTNVSRGEITRRSSSNRGRKRR